MGTGSLLAVEPATFHRRAVDRFLCQSEFLRDISAPCTQNAADSALLCCTAEGNAGASRWASRSCPPSKRLGASQKMSECGGSFCRCFHIARVSPVTYVHADVDGWFGAELRPRHLQFCPGLFRVQSIHKITGPALDFAGRITFKR